MKVSAVLTVPLLLSGGPYDRGFCASDVATSEEKSFSSESNKSSVGDRVSSVSSKTRED